MASVGSTVFHRTLVKIDSSSASEARIGTTWINGIGTVCCVDVRREDQCPDSYRALNVGQTGQGELITWSAFHYFLTYEPAREPIAILKPASYGGNLPPLTNVLGFEYELPSPPFLSG